MEMCGRHLLESVNGKWQLVFPFLDCGCYKLLRIGPVLPVQLVIPYFVFFCFFQRMFISFLMKMIYINNKQCEKSADAVCYRVTWKNNDERHQALMRHLELHIKRQPGVFLHSLGNWSLSLMPFTSLKGWMLWFVCQMGHFVVVFLLYFDSFLMFLRDLSASSVFSFVRPSPLCLCVVCVFGWAWLLSQRGLTCISSTIDAKT